MVFGQWSADWCLVYGEVMFYVCLCGEELVLDEHEASVVFSLCLLMMCFCLPASDSLLISLFLPVCVDQQYAAFDDGFAMWNDVTSVCVC